MKWKLADSAWLTALKSRIGQVTSESFRKPDQEGRFAMDHPTPDCAVTWHEMRRQWGGFRDWTPPLVFTGNPELAPGLNPRKWKIEGCADHAEAFVHDCRDGSRRRQSRRLRA